MAATTGCALCLWCLMPVHEERMIVATDGNLNLLTIGQEFEAHGKNGNIFFVIETQSLKVARVELGFDEACRLVQLLAAFCEQRRIK